MSNIIINEKFEPLRESKARYYIITGGRGSSKSFSTTLIEGTNTFKQGYNCLYTRYTMTSAELSIIPEFNEKIELLKSSDYFDVNRKEITNTITGSKIIFRGIKTSAGNQTANLKSLQGISTWVLDEAEEMVDENEFDTIDLSVRSNTQQNRIILILNPTTKEHWIYRRFFETKGVKEGFNGVIGDTCYIHTTYLDNKENLPDSFLNNIENIRLTNPNKYKHKILGGWLDKAEGVVFTNWSFGVFNPDGLQTSAGMDFGFSVDPDTLTEVAIDKNKRKIYVKEHLYRNGLGTTELAEIILNRVGKKLIIADSAEPRLISDLKFKGVNIKAVKKGTIESGITTMQDFEIVVDINSNNIAKELNNYVYLDKGSKLYLDDFNHAIDGIRYNVIYNLDNPNKGTYYIR
jgi:phage terminase large subunit|tara:strand:+ start:1508 stop:2719 length:1212 start_codon:yes stop_codon:yes gene_type:complete